MKKKFHLFASFFTLLASANIIYFNNNDIDEGFIEIKDNVVIIKSKKLNGEYGISTNRITKIDYGKWFKDFQYEYETEKMDKADVRIFVIGNSYFDAHGSLWQELENNNGKLTKHQEILP